jgi:KDO2-lipid IV(A) lauroyltransferase
MLFGVANPKPQIPKYEICNLRQEIRDLPARPFRDCPFMIQKLLDRLARLPMAWFHRAGNAFGWLMYCFSPADARRLRDNLRISGAFSSEGEFRTLLKSSICETGKTAAEWTKVWFAPPGEIESLVIGCDGWQLVEDARGAGKPIIFLMPHLGSFHVLLLYLAQRLPLTALYRPPPVRWLERYVLEGARRAGLGMAPTDLKGVQMLLEALRRGEAVVLPPDQAPRSRGGVWTDFFGRPAYTSTLPKKLQRATGASTLIAFAERLPRAGGFRLHFEPVSAERFSEAALNRQVERLVLRCPSQYLWSYNRYRTPSRAKPPGEKRADPMD